jgi:hypothetical protein
MTLFTGDVLHCTRDKLLSRIIRAATHSKFNHTALFLEIEGQPFIMDAQKDGVNLRPFAEWQEDYDYSYLVHRREELSKDIVNLKAFVVRAMSKSGNTRYDYSSLIIKQPLELIFKKWHVRPHEDERMYCSEFVMWCYGAPECYRMSPQDAYEWCARNGFREVLPEAVIS